VQLVLLEKRVLQEALVLQALLEVLEPLVHQLAFKELLEQLVAFQLQVQQAMLTLLPLIIIFIFGMGLLGLTQVSLLVLPVRLVQPEALVQPEQQALLQVLPALLVQPDRLALHLLSLQQFPVPQDLLALREMLVSLPLQQLNQQVQ
jgi:hypothetical protein